MEFRITVRFSGKKTVLSVKRIYQDEYKERYLVTGKTYEYTFERTLPLALHMALRPISTWKLLEPKTLHGTAKSDIINALKKEVE